MTGQAAGFLIVFGLVLVALALLGRLMRGLFKFAGLGLFDQLGGAALGIVKVALLVSVLLGAYESIQPHPPLDRRRKKRSGRGSTAR